jgi:hypothetical protein
MRLDFTLIRIFGYVVTGLLLRVRDSTLKIDTLFVDFVGSFVELDIAETLLRADCCIGSTFYGVLTGSVRLISSRFGGGGCVLLGVR